MWRVPNKCRILNIVHEVVHLTSGVPDSEWDIVGEDCRSPLSRFDTLSQASAGRAAMILVVDDDEEVRVVVAEFLEDFGYTVIQADGGLSALRVLETTPGIRLIITDIRMPDMSGLELADIATSRRSELRIILISGYFKAQQGTRPFLRKPFRMRELQAAVHAELETVGRAVGS